MAYATPRMVQTVLRESFTLHTLPSFVPMRPERASASATQNRTAEQHLVSAMATELFGLMLPFAVPTVFSAAAWVLLGMAFTYVTVPPQRRGRRPKLSDRLTFTIKPTMILCAIQLGLALLCIQVPTAETYEVKLTGKQKHQEVCPLQVMALRSWILTATVILTISGILAVFRDMGKWMGDAIARFGNHKLPPLCP